jgi:hypothetical protein
MLSTLAVLGLAVFIAFRTRRQAAAVVGGAVIVYVAIAAYIFPWYIVWSLPVLALLWRTRLAWLAVAVALAHEIAYVPDSRPIGLLKQPHVDTFLQAAQVQFRSYGVPVLSLVAVVVLVRWLAGGVGGVEVDGRPAGPDTDAPPRDEQQRLDDGAARELGVTGGAVGEDDRHLADRGAD